ncbi:hypothetical protein Syun_014188 [Stephania yunnanensis]|uniref:Uncharacterized protein n=1 Tax=Stephania yunnanensis TaxID=152371 RepID=A0AAP0P8C8_9MAGN
MKWGFRSNSYLESTLSIPSFFFFSILTFNDFSSSPSHCSRSHLFLSRYTRSLPSLLVFAQLSLSTSFFQFRVLSQSQRQMGNRVNREQ